MNRGEATDRIMRSSLPLAQKGVLLCYLSHQNSAQAPGAAISYPGLKTLTAYIGSRSAAQRARLSLLSAGVLIEAGKGKRGVLCCRIDFKKISPHEHYVQNDYSQIDHSQNDHSTMVDLSTEPSLENLPYNSPPVVPPGDTPQPPVEKSRKPKRRRRAALSLEQIAAVDVPAELASLDGFTERWLEYAEHRQSLKVRWKSPDQPQRMLRKLCRDAGKGLDVVTALEESTANGYQGVFPKPPRSAPAAASADENTPTPRQAWRRIQAALNDEISADCPGPASGWHLWPRSKHPRVHDAMMAALCSATEQDYQPYAWQMLLQARRKGPDSYDLNQLGHAFVRSYPAAWQTVRGAA